MPTQMTHWERLRATLRRQVTDRVPVSMWRHFYKDETSAEGLAAAMLGFQRQYDWDFVKVNARASYHVEDWGVKTRYAGDAAPEVIETPVKAPDDWLKLSVLNINQGVLQEHLRSLQLIAEGLKGEVPFVMTVLLLVLRVRS